MFSEIIFGLIVLCVLAIPVTVGVIVYTDAKSRGVDALLWALVAVLVPSFIGVIIYLVIRQGNLANTGISCSSCGKPVKKEWKTCPYCSKDLSVGAGVIKTERKNSFKWLFVLLALEVIVPAAMIIVQLIIVYS